MKQSVKREVTNHDNGSTSGDNISGLALGVQLLDTAWRVAVPIVALTLLGIKLDRHYHTHLWFTLAGFFLSLTISGLLVYRQIVAAYPDFFKFGSKNGDKL